MIYYCLYPCSNPSCFLMHFQGKLSTSGVCPESCSPPVMYAIGSPVNKEEPLEAPCRCQALFSVLILTRTPQRTYSQRVDPPTQNAALSQQLVFLEETRASPPCHCHTAWISTESTCCLLKACFVAENVLGLTSWSPASCYSHLWFLLVLSLDGTQER